MRSSDVYPINTHYMIRNEGEPGRPLLSLRPELLSNFLLPCAFAVERWIPEYEQSREADGVGALLISLPTIQTTIKRKDIRGFSLLQDLIADHSSLASFRDHFPGALP